MIHDWIRNNLKPEGVVVEAGVYDGQDTSFLCEHFYAGKVYGFEPIPSIFNQAQNKIKNYSNVILYEKALSNKTGKDLIYLSDRFGVDFASSSILKPKDHLWFHKEITFNKQIEIETIKLDDWYDENHINIIDLLWLDMQGAEPVVLSSSLKTLINTKYLYTEVSLIETYENVIQYPEFKKFLIENNFEVVFEDLPWKDMGNVLYKNKFLV